MDLSKILKGHEEEIFYSVIFGYITLKYILKETLVFKVVQPNGAECEIYYSKTGKYKNSSYLVFQKCTLFPSKENQDWEEWEKEHSAVEQYKVGQYFILSNVTRYQITNVNDKETTTVNISSGNTMAIKNSEFKDKINSKKIKIIDNIEDILEPFDKVLIQFREDGPWRLDFYSNFDGSNIHCINHCVTKEYILPYYPNKHLFNDGKK